MIEKKEVRKNKEKIVNTLELEKLFKRWLKHNHPLYFYLFPLLSFYQNLKLKIIKK